MSSSRPAPPRGTAQAGRRLWKAITADFELAEHELALLREAVRTVDDLDRLAAVVADEGPTRSGRVHPCLVEARQLRLTLARLLASLRVPDDDDARPQRRGAARGAYAKGSR